MYDTYIRGVYSLDGTDNSITTQAEDGGKLQYKHVPHTLSAVTLLLPASQYRVVIYATHLTTTYNVIRQDTLLIEVINAYTSLDCKLLI